MGIGNFTHKGLRRLYVQDDTKGVPPDIADKLRKTLDYLDDTEGPAELRALGAWRAHTLSGDRKGWSLSFARNHRLTSWIDAAEGEVCDLNREVYH